MEERLVVKNFGPIKDMDIRIGKLTVLIGEQATGKSTLGKLLAVCRYFSSIQTDKNGEEGFFKSGLERYGIESFFDSMTEVSYENHHYRFSAQADGRTKVVEVEPDRFRTDLSYVIDTELNPKTEAFNLLVKQAEQVKEINDFNIQNKFYQSQVAYLITNPFYLPTERELQSIFSLGRDSVSNFSDILFNQFAQMDQIARHFKNDTEIPPLEIIYKNVVGYGYFQKKKGQDYYSMHNAASGYQSTVPIVLLIEYYTQIRKKKKTFIIEEPELNLFPTTQHKLMQYLVSNLNQTENQIFITTHSPYVLAALNNMLSAYKSGQIHRERTAAILPEKYWLNPAEVAAYRLMPDGTAKDLMNREVDMIHSEEIDEASEILNRQFDELVTIQLEQENG